MTCAGAGPQPAQTRLHAASCHSAAEGKKFKHDCAGRGPDLANEVEPLVVVDAVGPDAVHLGQRRSHLGTHAMTTSAPQHGMQQKAHYAQIDEHKRIAVADPGLAGMQRASAKKKFVTWMVRLWLISSSVNVMNSKGV
jgi:hypothetical protein